MRRRLQILTVGLCTLGGLATGGCEFSDGADDHPVASEGETASPPDLNGGDTTTTSAGGGGTDGEAPGVTVEVCPAVFRFSPPFSLQSPRVAGEWHDFDLDTAAALTDADGDGTYEVEVDLPPGLHAYKLVYTIDDDVRWELDPGEGRRKYVDGIENSAVQVRDCNLPALAVASSERSRNGFSAALSYTAGSDGSDAIAPLARLRHAGEERDVGDRLILRGETIEVDLDGLEDGKHTLYLTPRSASGREGEVLRLPFWVEDEPFDWNGSLIYMVMADRYRNGDPNNDAPVPTPGADPRADWAGGDYEGLRQSIAEGLLDDLAIGAIWLTPSNANPVGAYLDADGVHRVTGYHGYWPVKAREVDARLGGAEALHGLVEEAHAHGIRILMDYVVNHVHEEHEYVAEHPDWFRTGCVCGQNGCDWTADALQCQFAPYMPDIDHRVPAANQQFVEDAIWWLDTFDLDGLRVDAVKHVETSATQNLAVAVREQFEQAGTRYFLMGETAMGWNECADPCNDENYETIARYIGPHGLDGQFDFVLYHGVSYRTFARSERGMLHADYWFTHGQDKWPDEAIMTPYLGSHDTPRFISYADYRNQDAAHPSFVPDNKWNDTAIAPSDSEPYHRLRVGMSWLLMLPGAPLLYYGDEYGQWGGGDPNNRIMWRPAASLNPDETSTLSYIQDLAQARASHPALRTGRYESLYGTEDTLAFARTLPGTNTSAVVVLTRRPSGATASFHVSNVALHGTLDDLLDGPSAVVGSDGRITVTLDGTRPAAVLVPR
ncbi:MAG: alpha-amylase family glycosyl hydrolase [Myxococcota bacterium]